jgi:hypothetical protein
VLFRSGHVMQANDVTRHSRYNTTDGSIYHHTLLRLLLPVCIQKNVAHDFRYDPRRYAVFIAVEINTAVVSVTAPHSMVGWYCTVLGRYFRSPHNNKAFIVEN